MSIKHLPLALAAFLFSRAALADLPGGPPAPPAEVPEPETLALLAVAGLAGWVARRIHRK